VPWTLADLDGQPAIGYPTCFIALIVCLCFPRQGAFHFRQQRLAKRTGTFLLGIQIASSAAQEELMAKLDEHMTIPMMGDG
jgi:hypothetical protein